MVQAPKSMDEFLTQANAFTQRARAKGLDENGIANTIEFMYGLTQQNIQNQTSAGMDGTMTNSDFGTGIPNQPGGGNQTSSGVPQFDFRAQVDPFPGGKGVQMPSKTAQYSSAPVVPAGDLWKPQKMSLNPSFSSLKAQYPAQPAPQIPAGPTNGQIGQTNPSSWQAQYITKNTNPLGL